MKRVTGRMLDEKDTPLEIIVKAIELNGNCYPSLIGSSSSDRKGYFDLELSESADHIMLCFYHARELVQVIEKKNFNGDIDLGDISASSQNIAVKGRVVDEEGVPVDGLMVTAFDVDIGPDDFLGCKWTDEEGEYMITYDPSRYHFQLDEENVVKTSLNPISIIKKSLSLLDREPDIKIIVNDKLGVFELKRSEEYSDVGEVVKEIEDIIIPRSWVEGWSVTLENEKPQRITADNSFQPLIDNERALEEIMKSIRKAEDYIYLTQFQFRPDFLAKPKISPEGVEGSSLADTLITASEKGVKVRILINQNLLIPDDYDEIAEMFQDTQVVVRPFDAQGPHAMHAKVLVVDGRDAFIIGSPFTQDYWDTVKHFLHDLRRGSPNKQPVHDVSIHIKGGVATYIEEYFIELWNYLSNEKYDGKDKLVPHADALPAGKQALQVVRSITPRTILENGERGVLEMYRRAIYHAEDFIYMENQYFTNPYIVKALKSALEKNKDLQLILIINGNPDVPTYRFYQHRRLKKLGLDLEGPLLDHPRIGVYNLWGLGEKKGMHTLQPFYVHSKVSIVDDKWATIGTSNLDGSSLSGAEEFTQITNPDLHLNMEINAVILDTEKVKTGDVRNFREELWSEHLGLDKMKRNPSGWLELWRETALKNVELLRNDNPTMQGHILPYTPANKSMDKIKSLDIINDHLMPVD
jgi:phosphatidylserine/phosphatidylglycerophosphate/cardiolipin synthase-like enzyme